MDNTKKLLKWLLYPHIVFMLLLLPISTVILVYSMVFIGTKTVVAYVSYVISAYTLAVWCIRIPKLITFCKKFKSENKYAQMWFNDAQLRVNISLYSSFTWNVAYAVFQLCLGLYYSSFWYCSLTIYYVCLAFMRFFLLRHIRKHAYKEKMRDEFMRYKICGIILLIMNIALSLMIFFMVYWNRTFKHHEITTIALAAYTFVAFTVAIIDIVKYRKVGSPVFSAAKAINLAAASVSMITLTSTMLTAFGENDNIIFRKVMLGSVGSAVSIFIVSMAIYMIVRANKLLKKYTK